MRKYYIVLFTGARDYANPREVWKVIRDLCEERTNIAVVHGGAKGADELADLHARAFGVPSIRIDAQWDFFKRAAGPIRNQWMLDLLDISEVHAFHPDLSKSKGTADMVKRAEKKGLKVTVHC